MVVIYSGPETNVAQVSGGRLYVQAIGSPNYNLPVSASFDSIGGSSLAPISVSGLAIGGRMDTTGSYVMLNVRNLAGSYALYVYDTAGAAGTTNVNITQVSGTNITSSVPVIGSVQVSSVVAALPAGTALLGSVKATPDGYYQILGSPNYNLPVIGSVQVSSITGALPAGTALLGSVVTTPVGTTSILGSTEISNTSAKPVVVIGSTLYAFPIVGSANYSLPVIGSIQVSSITGALPAGTVILGSVKADVNTVRDLLGSVQVSSIVGALPAGTVILGSVKADITKQEAWFNTGSAVDVYAAGSSMRWSFDWVGAITTGSNITTSLPVGSTVAIENIICSSSGDSYIELFWSGTNSLANRVAKASLGNFGGFVTNYTHPVRGYPGSPLLILVSGTISPVGFITIEGFLTG